MKKKLKERNIAEEPVKEKKSGKNITIIRYSQKQIPAIDKSDLK